MDLGEIHRRNEPWSHIARRVSLSYMKGATFSFGFYSTDLSALQLRNRASFYYDILILMPTILITVLSFGVFYMSHEVGVPCSHLRSRPKRDTYCQHE